MKLTIKTTVWEGEYDSAEFTDGHEAVFLGDGYVHVTEEWLLNPESTVTLTESGAPGM